MALAILATIVAPDAVELHHVDHRLRGDSHLDAEAVRALAGRLQVDCVLHEVEIAPGSNLEARARAARYGVLPENVLTAHTVDDQAETVLLQLFRGGGLDALAGMRPQNRPILALRRSDTVAVCETFGVTPREDPSNRDPRHRRNRVRHELLASINEIFERDVSPLLSRAAALAGDERDLLDEMASHIDVTDAVGLASAPAPLARRAVRAWLRGDHPPDSSTVERVLAVARGERRATEVGGSRRVERSGQRLRLIDPRSR